MKLASPILLVVLLSSITSCSGPGSHSLPPQPVKFNHKIHASDHRIPCLFCHRFADRSPVAGVPAVKICMGCHEIIGADKPEVERLAEFWNEEKPIEWIKIYDLPDFVRFTHKRHVLAGVECEKCHGSVENMNEVRKVRELTMGWCLACHKKEHADIDCLVCHY